MKKNISEKLPEKSACPALDLVVVMPVYNEEKVLSRVIRQWQTVLNQAGINYGFVIVNDGSKDRTGLILKQLENQAPKTFTILSQVNFGHGHAIRKGYEKAVQLNPAWVLQIDSDGQCRPDYFPGFWSLRKHQTCIFGNRVIRKDGRLRFIMSRICSLVVFVLSGLWIKDANVPFRLMPCSVLNTALKKIPSDIELQNIALSIYIRKYMGTICLDIPIVFQNRQEAGRGLTLLQILRLGCSMIQIFLSLKKELMHDS